MRVDAGQSALSPDARPGVPAGPLRLRLGLPVLRRTQHCPGSGDPSVPHPRPLFLAQLLFKTAALPFLGKGSPGSQPPAWTTVSWRPALLSCCCRRLPFLLPAASFPDLLGRPVQQPRHLQCHPPPARPWRGRCPGPARRLQVQRIQVGRGGAWALETQEEPPGGTAPGGGGSWPGLPRP